MSTRVRTGRVRSVYEFIKSHRDQYPVDVMCRILDVAPSGYYDWLGQPVSKRAQEDARLLRLRREGLRPEDPLFCSQTRRRISPRRVQFAFRTWQVKAGFDRLYPFHALRHTAVTNVYRKSRDLFLAQRFARHVSPLTTTVYTHPNDQELWERVRGLRC